MKLTHIAVAILFALLIIQIYAHVDLIATSPESLTSSQLSLQSSYMGTNDSTLYLKATYKAAKINHFDSYDIKFDFEDLALISHSHVNVTVNGVPRLYLADTYPVNDNAIPIRQISFNSEDSQLEQPTVMFIFVFDIKVGVIPDDEKPVPSLTLTYHTANDNEQYSASQLIPIELPMFPSSSLQLVYDREMAQKIRAPFVFSFLPTSLPNVTSFYLQIIGSHVIGGDMSSCVINKVPILSVERIDGEEIYRITVKSLPRSRENVMACPSAYFTSTSQLLFELSSHYQIFTYIDKDEDDNDDDDPDGDDDDGGDGDGDDVIVHQHGRIFEEKGVLHVNSGIVHFFDTSVNKGAKKAFQILIGTMLAAVLLLTTLILCCRRECCKSQKQVQSSIQADDTKYFVFGGDADMTYGSTHSDDP